MTTTGVRQLIDAMGEEGRFFASAYLRHLANRSDVERQSQLTERLERMETGRCVSFDQLKDLDESLAAHGL